MKLLRTLSAVILFPYFAMETLYWDWVVWTGRKKAPFWWRRALVEYIEDTEEAEHLYDPAMVAKIRDSKRRRRMASWKVKGSYSETIL